MEQPPADLVLLQHQRHGLGLIERRLAGAARFRVRRERLLQLVGQAQVVHHQPAGLVLEHAVDARDGLHQPVPAHRLVHVHRVQARRVEAGEPHVAHDHDPERIGRIAEARSHVLAPRLVADVLLPVERVRRRAGHHHLERALLIVVAVPRRAQRDQLAVQLDRDAAAHHHHHRLAVHRGEPVLEVLHQVARDQLDAVLRTDHRLKLRPPALELLLALDLLALGRFLEFRVDLRPFGFLQLQLRQAALVVDRHRRAVVHGALDVIDADVVAEHRACVRIGLFDRRAGETDK